MKQILQSFKTGEMWLADVPAPLCKGKGAVVKTCASFVSAGTERMLAEFAKKGLVGKALQMPDQVKKVIRKMKTEGFFATLEKVQAKLDQPIPLGYSSAGVVVEAGRDCGFNVGDRVACGGAGFANHAEFDYVPKNLMVKIPEASEVVKLERKDLNSYINIGTPIKSLQAMYGTEARIQLNDSFKTTDDIRDFVAAERESMKESDRQFMTVSIRADQDVRMGIITDVKQELRRCSALKIMYSTRKAGK